MLVSALESSSDSVHLDLLTFADLEMLKSRKLGAKPSAQVSSSASVASGTSSRGREPVGGYVVQVGGDWERESMTSFAAASFTIGTSSRRREWWMVALLGWDWGRGEGT